MQNRFLGSYGRSPSIRVNGRLDPFIFISARNLLFYQRPGPPELPLTRPISFHLTPLNLSVFALRISICHSFRNDAPEPAPGIRFISLICRSGRAVTPAEYATPLRGKILGTRSPGLVDLLRTAPLPGELAQHPIPRSYWRVTP